MRTYTVIKRNAAGKETWRYSGQLLKQEGSRIVLEAYFDRDEVDISGLLLQRGDHFIETWFTDRWYNLFEVHAHDDDRLRGWYCNIGCPAEIEGATISYIDLALDLVVFPDGRQVVLDLDEFNALDLAPNLRQKALQALEELQMLFLQKQVDRGNINIGMAFSRND